MWFEEDVIFWFITTITSSQAHSTELEIRCCCLRKYACVTLEIQSMHFIFSVSPDIYTPVFPLPSVPFSLPLSTSFFLYKCCIHVSVGDQNFQLLALKRSLCMMLKMNMKYSWLQINDPLDSLHTIDGSSPVSSHIQTKQTRKTNTHNILYNSLPSLALYKSCVLQNILWVLLFLFDLRQMLLYEVGVDGFASSCRHSSSSVTGAFGKSTCRAALRLAQNSLCLALSWGHSKYVCRLIMDFSWLYLDGIRYWGRGSSSTSTMLSEPWPRRWWVAKYNS